MVTSFGPNEYEGMVNMIHVASTPRISTPRDYSMPTLGDYFDHIQGELRMPPYEWQSHLNSVSLQLSPRIDPFEGQSAMKLHAQNVGCMVGRQSGKTSWSVARIAGQALMPYFPEVRKLVGHEHIKPQRIIYTAQRRVVG